MVSLFGAHASGNGPARVLAFAIGIAVCVMPMIAASADINVVLDEARLVKLPDRVATIVIGNPLIADATVQSGGTMVITGKGYGVTNLIALDRAGAVLLDQSVEVRGPRAGVVTVFRGVERESYSCTPNCERRITLGDSPQYFEAVINQTGTRNAQAQGAAPSAK